MKIRLLIPESNNWLSQWYSEDSIVNLDNGIIRNCEHLRIEMLNECMSIKNNIDIVATSHNFFQFIDSFAQFNVVEFIKREIIPWLNQLINNKKPLIIGFDLLSTAKKKPKKTRKSSEIEYNPYGGIDAIVLYLKPKNNRYQYVTHIWECWRREISCPDCQSCFEEQNCSRTFELEYKKGNVKIGLLSCGDISPCCHDYGTLLPRVDIYVDLSHASVRGRTPQYNQPPRMINCNDYDACDYVVITHQVRRDTIRNYLRNPHNYRLIFPQNTSRGINPLYCNGIRQGITIDVDIP